MSNSHCFHLKTLSPQQNYPGGTRIDVNQHLFPVLQGISLSLLTVHPQAFREPHWHPNAHELSYCLEGRALMTIFSPGAEHDTLIIEPGTLAFVPMGSLHHIQNIGNEDVKMLICFSDHLPEDINFSSTLGAIPPQALGATFSLPASFFERLPRSLQPVFIGEGLQQKEPLPLYWQTNRFKMNIEGIRPQIQTAGGTVKINNRFLMPALEGLTMYSLRLEPKGVREPHWHPNAHELNYVVNGRVRIHLLSPNQELDSFDMGAGDISFLPRGYFHDIENIGEETAHLAVFFNHSAPSDIGISGCFGAYPNDLLAHIFQKPVSYFDSLPKYQEDLFVVSGAG